MEPSADIEIEEFLKSLPPEFEQTQQEMIALFDFHDRQHEKDMATTASLASKEHVMPAGSKTRKPRVKASGGDMTRVKQRFQSAQSIKFQSIEEEARFRLYSVFTKKTSLIDKLVRACYQECGNTWVTWKRVKDIAARVGYKPSSQLFKSVWVLTHCLYGSDNRNCTWLPALTFPYWELDTTRYAEAVALQGKAAVKDELYMLRLSEHFFTFAPVQISI